MKRQHVPWVVGFMILLAGAFYLFMRQPTTGERAKVASPTPLGKAQQHLDWADRETAQALARQLRTLDAFFSEAKQGTPRFADKALGWASKWRLLTDWLPFTQGGEHEAYLREAFADCVFTASQLEKVTQQTVKGFVDSVEAIENTMLVRIGHDIADLPPFLRVHSVNPQRLQQVFKEALAQAGSGVGGDIKTDIAKEVVSIITAEVLGRVAIRLGVSSGLLSAAAGTSWATFGVSVVAGLAVDQALSWAWDRWADPQGKLTAELNHKLDGIHRLIVEGCDQQPGLRQRLTQFAKQRALIRRQAIRKLLEGKGGNK